MGLTPAQLKYRKGTIGGSEIAAIVGINPWMRPIDVFLDKTGRSERAVSAPMEWGTRLEPAVLGKWADEHGVTLVHPRDAFPDSIDGTVQHPECAVASATPDGVVVIERPSALVQVKCPGIHALTSWGDDPNGAPESVVLQSIWEQEVTGVHAGHIAALIGGNEYREYIVPFDAELAGMLVEHAQRFMRNYVANDVAPPLDGSESSSRYLRERFARNNGTMLLGPPPGAYELAREYRAAADAEKSARAIKDAAANRLKEMIGDADGFEGPGLRVTWKLQNGQPAYKAIAESLGATKELIAAHTPSNRVISVNVKE